MYRIVLVIVCAAALVIGAFFYFRGGTGGIFSPKKSAEVSVSVSTQRQLPHKAAQPKTYQNVVAIDAQNFFFKPDLFYAKINEKVSITVHALGDQSLVMDEFGVSKKVADGKTAVIEFTPAKKGTFRFYSDIPGHREAGQEGVMIVE